MGRFFRLLTPVIIAQLVVVPAAAQDSTDSPSDEEAQLRDENWGLAFSAPEGWFVREVPGRRAYLVGSNTTAGFVLVLPLRNADLEGLRADMREGFHEQGGTVLRPDGSIEAVDEDALAVDYRGTMNGQRVEAHVVSRVSPHGLGVSALAVAVPERFGEAHREAARALVRHARFFSPETPPAVSEWRERLGGRVLSKYSRYDGGLGGGSTSVEKIDLCTGGHFYYESDNQASFNTGEPTGGYVAGERRGAGRWKVVARLGRPVLRLEFHGGEVREYGVEWGEEIPGSSARYTSLDGADYLRTPSARPDCDR